MFQVPPSSLLRVKGRIPSAPRNQACTNKFPSAALFVNAHTIPFCYPPNVQTFFPFSSTIMMFYISIHIFAIAFNLFGTTTLSFQISLCYLFCITLISFASVYIIYYHHIESYVFSLITANSQICLQMLVKLL